VDGTYNARYEVVKKRIDKSQYQHQRTITEKEKITLLVCTTSKKPNI
jgi:hypothetical protein